MIDYVDENEDAYVFATKKYIPWGDTEVFQLTVHGGALARIDDEGDICEADEDVQEAYNKWKANKDGTTDTDKERALLQWVSSFYLANSFPLDIQREDMLTFIDMHKNYGNELLSSEKVLKKIIGNHQSLMRKLKK